MSVESSRVTFYWRHGADEHQGDSCKFRDRKFDRQQNIRIMRLEAISAARAANVRRSKHAKQREMMQLPVAYSYCRQTSAGEVERGKCNAGRVEYRLQTQKVWGRAKLELNPTWRGGEE